MTAECDSVNERHHEVVAELLRELFDQCRRGAVPTHPAELASFEAKVASLTIDLELELQVLPA